MLTVANAVLFIASIGGFLHASRIKIAAKFLSRQTEKNKHGKADTISLKFLLLHNLHFFLTLHRLLSILAPLRAERLFAGQAQLLPGSRGPLALRSQTQHTAGVDEELRRVELGTYTEFRGRIVEGVLVVPVVPTFAHREVRHKRILSRHDGGIVGVITVEMSGGVYQPGEVQHADVSQRAGGPVAVPEVVAPQHAHEAGEHEAHEEVEPGVELHLESHHRIGEEVVVVEGLASRDHVLVLLRQQPAHVGEEEAPAGVMGIRVSLGKKIRDKMERQLES